MSRLGLAFMALTFCLCSQFPIFAKVNSPDSMPQGTFVTRGTLYALVVGVSRYKDQALPRLKLADRDAQAFGDFLKTQDRLFQKVQITYLLNEKATKAEIEKYLYYTLPRAGKDDTVVLFLSGHGRFDPMRPKEFFFLPSDAENEYIAATGVKMSGLDFLNGISAEKVLLIADACHAGGFSQMKPKANIPSLELFLKEAKNSSGRAIITSSRDGQLSWELPGENNSVFTHHLLEGLKGKADRDHDGLVTLNEAYEYAYAQTKEATKGHQHPQFEGSVVGMFPLSFVGSPLSSTELKTKLLDSARTGARETIVALLSCGVDVDVREGENATPLILAASNGHGEIVRLLLEKKAEVNASDNYRKGALIGAASIGNLQIVQMLLDAGAKVDLKDSEGWTPLAHASHKGHTPVVQALLNQGADFRARTNTGDTPLALAASQGYLKTVAVLLDWGAELESVDLQGVNPLIKACRGGHVKCAELLLRRSAGLKLRWGTTDQSRLLVAAVKGDAAETRRLLKEGIPVDTETDTGDTAFTLAASLGHVDVMKVLAQKNANINFKSQNDRTPLMMASSLGNLSVVSTLLKLGADINAQDTLGNTPLMLAVRNGQLDVVRTLLSESADLNAANNRGSTPLLAAVEDDHVEMVTMLLGRRARVNDKDSSGATALLIAAKKGNSEITKLLLNKKANVDAQDLEGRTALMHAVKNGHKAVLNALVAAGADVYARDWEGKTALTQAEETGRSELVQLLQRHKDLAK